MTATFALGALLLSVSMGAISYFTTRHFLVGERESAEVHAALENASLVQVDLRDNEQPVDVLTATDKTTVGSFSVLRLKGTWYERAPSVGPSAIPKGLKSLVAHGTAATQTYLLRPPHRSSTPEIVVGVPLRTVQGAYYELFDISDLQRTLNVLALALFIAGLVTTLLGGLLGRWASGRSLRPLTGVSRAAVAIAGGELGTRLTAGAGDPDLAALTSSFNRMVDQLQERIEREARFASDVSHELRSPLTTLAASLEVLEAQSRDLSPSGRRALELLAGDLRRFQRMVADLLEISRSDAGSTDASFEEVDPGELVRRSVAAAQAALAVETPPPRVEVDASVARTRILVDKRRFERVISNLLENAALYGGGATVVRVGPGVDPHAVRVSVEDAGPGLPPSERSKIFERFYRGHAAYKRGAGTGTGLGLALVAEHVRLHGGRVWADEAADGGARFTIELPGGPADDAGLEEVAEADGDPHPVETPSRLSERAP